MLQKGGFIEDALGVLLSGSDMKKWLSTTFDLLSSIIVSIRKDGLPAVMKIGAALDRWVCPDGRRKSVFIALNAIEEASLSTGLDISKEDVMALSDRLYISESLFTESNEWPMQLHLLGSLSLGQFSAFKRKDISFPHLNYLESAAQALTSRVSQAFEAISLSLTRSSFHSNKDAPTINALAELEKAYCIFGLSKPQQVIKELQQISVACPWSFATSEPVQTATLTEAPDDWEKSSYSRLPLKREEGGGKDGIWFRPVAVDAMSMDLSWKVRAVVSEYCFTLLNLQARLHASGSSLVVSASNNDEVEEADDSRELVRLLKLIVDAIKLQRAASDLESSRMQLISLAYAKHRGKCPSYIIPSAAKAVNDKSSQLRLAGKALWVLLLSTLNWSPSLPPHDLYKSIVPQVRKDLKAILGEISDDHVEGSIREALSLADPPARHPTLCLSSWVSLSALLANRSINSKRLLEERATSKSSAARPELLISIQVNLKPKLCLPEMVLDDGASTNRPSHLVQALSFYIDHNIFKRSLATSSHSGPKVIPLALEAQVTLLELAGARIILGTSKNNAFLSPGLCDIMSVSFTNTQAPPPHNILNEWKDREMALRMAMWLTDACYRTALMLLPDTEDIFGGMQSQVGDVVICALHHLASNSTFPNPLDPSFR